LTSVVLLGVFLVAIYQPLMTSLNALNYAESRLEAGHLAANKIWEFREALKETGKLPKINGDEVLMGRRKTYRFLLLSTGPIEKKLYTGRAFISWPSGGGEKKFSRVFYFTKPQKFSL